jgi:hypothetical protein
MLTPQHKTPVDMSGDHLGFSPREPEFEQFEPAPTFCPATIGVGRSLMPCWVVMAAIRGAEQLVARTAAGRRISV